MPNASQAAGNGQSDLQRLHSLLEERLNIVADRESYAHDSAAHLASLMQKSNELNAFFSSVRHTLDPMLIHYFERQSYQKALAWLEEELA